MKSELEPAQGGAPATSNADPAVQN